MTAEQLTSQMIADTRRQLDTARVASAYAHGELTLSVAERCWLLADEARLHKAAGRHAEAAQCKERAMQILDEAGWER